MATLAIDFDAKEQQLRHQLADARRRRAECSVAEITGSLTPELRSACADVAAVEALIEDLGVARQRAAAEEKAEAERRWLERRGAASDTFRAALSSVIDHAVAVDRLTPEVAVHIEGILSGLEEAAKIQRGWVEDGPHGRRKEERFDNISHHFSHRPILDWLERAANRAGMTSTPMGDSLNISLGELVSGRVEVAIQRADEFPELRQD